MPMLVNAVPLTSAHWRSLGVPEEPLALVIHQDVRLLKEADYFKDEFISIATHELRQPLTVLKVAVGTLVLQTARGHGTPLAAWQQEMLEDLRAGNGPAVHLDRRPAGCLAVAGRSVGLATRIHQPGLPGAAPGGALPEDHDAAPARIPRGTADPGSDD